MATTTNLEKVHVFPSEESYNANKGSVGDNDLALVPIGAATTQEYGLSLLADDSALLNEDTSAALTVNNAYALNDFRRMNTAYEVGDKVNCAFRFEYFLECTQAGTTSANSLDTKDVTFGQEIEDGTCKWIVRAHVKSVNGQFPDASGGITIETQNIEIASLEEAKAGTDDTKMMTPLKVKSAVEELAPQADWNATSGKAQILNKPSLANVATTGSYNDLSNKPSIPSRVDLGSATLTALIDWTTMNKYATNGNVKNINNTSTEIVAFGGDIGYTSNSVGLYNAGDIKLKYSWTGYDAILFIMSNDEGSLLTSNLLFKFEFEKLYNTKAFKITTSNIGSTGYWEIYGKNNANNKSKSDTVFASNTQNGGIVEIYGVNW